MLLNYLAFLKLLDSITRMVPEKIIFIFHSKEYFCLLGDLTY